MAWALLVVAGLLEVCWAIGLTYTHGFTRLLPSLFTIVALAASMLLLSIAVRTLPVSTAYPVWVGIGALGTVLIGIVALREPWSPATLFFAAMVAGGIIGLQVSAPGR